MLRRTFKFKAQPMRKWHVREERDQRNAMLFVAVPTCIVSYYLFGAGGWMLFLSMLAYVIARFWMMRRRR